MPIQRRARPKRGKEADYVRMVRKSLPSLDTCLKIMFFVVALGAFLYKFGILPEPDLVICGQQVAVTTRRGETDIRPACLEVREGVITSISSFREEDGAIILDKEEVLMPGLVDANVHINEPGSGYETFESITRAAAAGGVTTVLDVPASSNPSATSLEALDKKIEASNGKLLVDVGFLGALVPGNTENLQTLLEKGGVFGFRATLADLGSEDFHPVKEEDLRAAFQAINEALPSTAEPREKPIFMFHAMDPIVLEKERAELSLDDEDTPTDRKSYNALLQASPIEAEERAIDTLVKLCGEYNQRCHINSLASTSAVLAVTRAQHSRILMTSDTTPHYLHFEADSIPDAAPEFKVDPPLRDNANRDTLWKSLRDGQGVLYIASDHHGLPSEVKDPEEGDLFAAAAGISSLELRLPVVWTGIQARGELGLPHAVEYLCARPAEIVGMKGKGRIMTGYDADFVVWDPTEKITVNPEKLHNAHPATPYKGEELQGCVHRTFVRGTEVFLAGDDEEGQEEKFGSLGTGKLLKS